VQKLKKFNGGSMQNKRIIAVFILLVFCAALAIGGSAVFTIAEVEASYTLISQEQKDKIADVDSLLNEFEGKNIMLLKNSEISTALKNYTYLKITQIDKVYPNSILVKISERKEIFAVLKEQSYYMLDIDGFVLSKKSTNQNNIDNQSNIILNAEGSFIIGEYADITEDDLFSCLINISKLTDVYFKSINANDYIRNTVLKISIINGMNINLVMSEGLIISITDAINKPEEKLTAGLTAYNLLSTEQKAAYNAKIIVIYDSNNKIIPTYSTN
jgi:hypothetical protein